MNNTELTRQEFFGLMMIYASNIDGEEHVDEINLIRESIGEMAFEVSYRTFESMNDYELINYFRDHKEKYLKSAMDEKMFLSEIKTVISADHTIDIMERTLLMALKKIIRE